MPRTDVHRPAALVPEDYDFRGVIDLYPDDLDVAGRQYGAALREQLLVTEGRVHASIHPHGQCDHCGARIRYAAYLVHRPTGKVLTVGETCLDNRFERSSEEFHAARKAAELDRAQQRIKHLRAAFLAEHEDLRDLIESELPEDAHHILGDLRWKAQRYGDLSERQVELARKLLAQDASRRAERAEREAAEPPAVPIPAELLGKGAIVEGVVLGITWRENAYGGAWKVLLQVPAEGGAFKVWTTAPAAALNDGEAQGLRGRTVRWTGTLELGSPRYPGEQVDPAFGFLRRPRVAK
jgi:hypothetical protein